MSRPYASRGVDVLQVFHDVSHDFVVSRLSPLEYIRDRSVGLRCYALDHFQFFIRRNMGGILHLSNCLGPYFVTEFYYEHLIEAARALANALSVAYSALEPLDRERSVERDILVLIRSPLVENEFKGLARRVADAIDRPVELPESLVSGVSISKMLQEVCPVLDKTLESLIVSEDACIRISNFLTALHAASEEELGAVVK